MMQKYNFIAMFISSGLESYRITDKTPKPGIGISNNGGIGMAEVRLRIHIINRGGYVRCHFDYKITDIFPLVSCYTRGLTDREDVTLFCLSFCPFFL